MQNASHLCKNRHIPYQKKGQHTNSRNTYYNNVKMGRSQHIGQRPRISSGFFEKSGKHTGLQQQGHSCYQSYTESIDQTLRHHCPQRLGKRSAVILCQNAATGYFTHTRDNQISGIRHKNSIHAVWCFGILTQRSQCKFPPPSPEDVTKHTKHQRKQHPTIIHPAIQYFPHMPEIKSAVHPYHYRSSQNQRK